MPLCGTSATSCDVQVSPQCGPKLNCRTTIRGQHRLRLAGRDAAGLAPGDLTLDASLRAGDVIATTDGLVAYSGIKVGNNQSPEFIPVASYPGLTAEVRARLGEMKVAPVAADAIGNEAPNSDVAAPLTPALKPAPIRDKRAALN